MATRKPKPEIEWDGQVQLPKVGAKKMRVEPEASVLTRVLQALDALPDVIAMRNRIGYDRRACRHYGLIWRADRKATGSADIVCLVGKHGRVAFVETKRGDGGRVSVEQDEFAARVRALGAVYGVATSPEEALAVIAQARVF